MRYIGKQEERFLNRLDSTTLPEFVFLNEQGDTLSVTSERTTIVLFWSTWSSRSLNELYDLYNWHDDHSHYDVIAAYVKDSAEFAEAHNRQDKVRFRMVDGTPVYQDLRIPGVPTAIVFNSGNEPVMTQVGSESVPVWHSLSPRQELQETKKTE